MSLSSNQIEIWAVDKVEETFTRSSHILPSIPRGDKNPAWDGAIYLLSSDKLTRRIPVQVKGKTRKSLPSKPSYPVSVTNLKNYLRDGGILYCVVFIIGTDKYFYYAKLAPIDLKRYIKAAAGRSSISVSLQPYSKSVPEMEQEMDCFINDCKKQTSFVASPILSLDEVIKQGHKINFQLTGTSSSEGTTFSNEPVYLYAEMQNGNSTMLYPIGDQAYSVVIGPHIKGPVSSNGKTYYDEFIMFDSKDERTFQLEDILEFKFKKEEGVLIPISSQVSSKASMLSNKIQELSLINEIVTSGEVSFGAQTITFRDIPQNRIKEIAQEYSYWQKARLLFDKIHITEDIEIGSFSKVDRDNLTMLMQAILEEKPIKLSQKIDSISHVNISKYCILLMTEDNEDGTYNIFDFFDSDEKLCFAYEDSEGQKLMTSMFTVAFQFKDFIKFSNVDYSKLIPSYELAKRHNPFITDRANDDTLLALKAYDKSEPKDSELYDAIVNLYSWVMKNSRMITPVHLINKCQIAKRTRQLEKTEILELCELLKTPNINPDFETAIHLLIDNKTQADICYDKMSPNEQKFFDSLPISFFRNNNYINSNG